MLRPGKIDVHRARGSLMEEGGEILGISMPIGDGPACFFRKKTY